MKRILVPSDLSAISENALKLAATIAGKVGAEIYLVNFMDHPFGSFSATGEVESGSAGQDNFFMIQLIKKNQERLGALAGKYGSDSTPIHFQVFDQELKHGVRAYINEYNIDMVVMGTSGESTLEEFFTGNHTEQVIERASCPVLSLKENYEIDGLKSMVLGVDLKEDNRDNFRTAATYLNDLADGLGIPVHIVNVVDRGTSRLGEIEEKLEAFADKYQISNYTTTVKEHNNKEQGLIYFAHEKEASILAVLTHAEGGFFKRLFQQSMSEEISKESDVPVLSINLHNI